MARNDGSHDFLHAERVWRAARRLCREWRESAGAGPSSGEGVDSVVVEVAALCHDVADHKYHPSPAAAEAILTELLSELADRGRLSPERCSRIRHIIENMSFSKEISRSEESPPLSPAAMLELQIVQDADRLDAIGAIGIARTFTFGGSRKRALYDPGDMPTKVVDLSGEEYAARSRSNATYNHFFEKLLKLKEMMKTSMGRRLAEERHRYMQEFLERFRQEIEGEA
uniref:HD/PDEase domain-containing protein n=1 Tax=Rhizochromulina marina TaxID=1034831 RepID=A0A7S2W5Q6_9STRA|mmetsp:Transcript_15201/g.45007  ORF Transcript_15201/g.45007 Transcript_15201/m.45007 type:complete len:227 (+) Transcript_15201:55-735(+)